jgi:hypothetical protein
VIDEEPHESEDPEAPMQKVTTNQSIFKVSSNPLVNHELEYPKVSLMPPPPPLFNFAFHNILKVQNVEQSEASESDYSH